MSGTRLTPICPGRNLGESSSFPLKCRAQLMFSKTLLTPLPVFPQSHLPAPALLAAFLFLRHAELIPLTSKVLSSDTLVKLTSAQGSVLIPTPTSSSSSGSVFFLRAYFFCQVFSCLLIDLLRCYIFSAPFYTTHHPHLLPPWEAFGNSWMMLVLSEDGKVAQWS